MQSSTNLFAPSAVVLIGFMGAGKTSVGRVLAAELGWSFEDLDERVERREGQSVAEIFRTSGEAEFRRAEYAALKELLDGLQAESRKIIALGGGAFVQPSNLALIESARVPTVFLDADIEELWRRCARPADWVGTERPLLGTLVEFRELYELRRPHYSRASLRQDTSGKTVKDIAVELIDRLKLQRLEPERDQAKRGINQ